MDPKQNSTLTALCDEIERDTGLSLEWKYDAYYGGAAMAQLPNDAWISVFVDPPGGQPHYKREVLEPWLSGNGDGSEEDPFDLDASEPDYDAPLPDTTLDDLDQDTHDELEERIPKPTGDDGWTITPWGAKRHGNPTFEQSLSLVNDCYRAYQGSRLSAGDILNDMGMKHGEKMAQAYVVAQEMGLSHTTVQQWQYIARRVPFEKRAGLTYTALRYVAYLPANTTDEAIDYYLDGHTTQETKSYIETGDPNPPEPDLPPCPACGAPQTLKSKCPACGRTFLDLAWWTLDLLGEIKAFAQTGEIGKTMKNILEGNDG